MYLFVKPFKPLGPVLDSLQSIAQISNKFLKIFYLSLPASLFYPPNKNQSD